MFQTQKIAGQIRQARIEKNMTQMDLADQLGVSYQAVSNWERGNSLPDISKLESLCQILQLSLEELLGVETSTAAAKAANDQSMTVEELGELAPMLPPSTIRRQVEQTRETLDLKALRELAPFLEESFLSELVLGTDLGDLEGLKHIAPFLSQDTLNQLAANTDGENLDALEDVLCFFSESTVDALLLKALESKNWDFIQKASVFASSDALDALVKSHITSGGSLDCLEALYPFLSQKTLHGLAQYLLKSHSLTHFSSLAHFL